MTHPPRHRFKTGLKTALLIFTLIVAITAQNTTDSTSITEITETTDLTTANQTKDSATVETTLPATNATTLPPKSTNESSSQPETTVTSTKSIIEPKFLLDSLQTNDDHPPDDASSPLSTTEVPELIAPKTQVHRVPPDCSHRERLRQQPKPSYSSKLRKCCPNGETLITEDGSSQYCDQQAKDFSPQIVKVELYENCIEDLEETVKLDLEVGNPCNESFIYGPSRGDRLMVLQDGSLLIMDQFANESYQIEMDYCLDTDVQTGELFAVVCVSSVEDHVGRGQTILFTCFMVVSIPCLAIVSFLHLAVKELRSVHGLSLSVMSACLAIGFFLHTIAQISSCYKSGLGYAVQFFMLAYFFWLFNLCCNVVMHVWYYLPTKTIITRTIRYVHFITYALVAFSIPFILVMVTKHKGLPGMPSYFFQGFTESIRESQRYFIPPVTSVLLISFCLLVVSFFGFKKVDQMTSDGRTYQAVYGQTTIPLPSVDQEGYQEIKKDAKCICCLFVIIIITWILEVVTFYSPGQDDYIAFMEIINGLQGVFILMIFIGIRRRRNAIVRWWHDRGSHEVTQVEMKNLRPSLEANDNNNR